MSVPVVRLDEEGAGGGERSVAPARFGAAQALGTYLFIVIAEWAVVTAVMTMFMDLAMLLGRAGPDPRTLAARAMAPAILAWCLVTPFFTLLAIRIFAWRLVRDRTPSGLGLFWPSQRTLVLWSAIGIVLGVLHYAMMLVLPGGTIITESAQLAMQTLGGRIAWWIATLVTPLASELLYRGLLLRGLSESWGIKAASVFVTLLYIARCCLDFNGNWATVAGAILLGVTTLAARLRTGSVFAAGLMNELYVLTVSLAETMQSPA